MYYLLTFLIGLTVGGVAAYLWCRMRCEEDRAEGFRYLHLISVRRPLTGADIDTAFNPRRAPVRRLIAAELEVHHDDVPRAHDHRQAG